MNKPKSDKDAGHPGPHENERKQHKSHVSGDITIRGQIETHFPPSVVDKQDADRKQDTAHEKKKFKAEILTIILLAVYAGLTAWQGCSARESVDLTRKQFQIDQRPWVK